MIQISLQNYTSQKYSLKVQTLKAVAFQSEKQDFHRFTVFFSPACVITTVTLILSVLTQCRAYLIVTMIIIAKIPVRAGDINMHHAHREQSQIPTVIFIVISY